MSDSDFCSRCWEPEGGSYCSEHGGVRRPFSIGERYEVDELIGAGTRSFVFGGRDARGGRVAIKVLRPQVAADLEARERFLGEASALRRLIHPHVIRVLDAGWDEQRGLAYLVMEREAGQAADAMITRAGPLPWSQAVPLLVQICRAVSAAHACGINDGEFTAGKVFLVTGVAGPVAKLRDFGLSRRASSGATASDDVYGIGTVAHELVTGRPPLEGSSATATLSDDPIRVNERFPALALPDALDDLIRACRLRDPLLRPTPSEIEDNLLALGSPESPGSPEHDAEATEIIPALPFSSVPDRLPSTAFVSFAGFAPVAPPEATTLASLPGVAPAASPAPAMFGLPAGLAPVAPVTPMRFGSHADPAAASLPAPIEAPSDIDAGATLPGAGAWFSPPDEAPPFRDGTAIPYSAVAHPGTARHEVGDHDPSSTLEDAVMVARRPGRHWILVGLGGALLAAAVFLGIGVASRSAGGTAGPARKVSEGAANSAAAPIADAPPVPRPSPSTAPQAAVADPVSAASVAPSVTAPAPASPATRAIADHARAPARAPGSAAPATAPGPPSTATAADSRGVGSGSGEPRPGRRARPDKKPEYKDVLIIDPFSRSN